MRRGAPRRRGRERARDELVRCGNAWAVRSHAAVVFAEGLPKTRSAKIVRRAVRAALTGDDAGDLSSLEDPQVLDAIRAAREP